MGLKHLTAWSCCQQFIGLLLARTARQSSILKQRSVPFTIGANTRKRALGQITFVKRGSDLRNKTGSNCRWKIWSERDFSSKPPAARVAHSASFYLADLALKVTA